jgi:pyruvyl transferase EpsO
LYRYQHHRERLLANYPTHRIVILPQTIYFHDKEKQRAAGRAMSRHGDVHLFVRDETSLDIARDSFASCSPVLAPDMAAFLYPLEETLRCTLSREITEEIFFLQRRDKERVDLSHLPALRGIKPIDWDDLQPLHFPFIIGVLVTAYVYARVLPAGPFFRWWREFCRKRAVVAAGRLNRSRFVATNRLHCHILACLLGVPNVLLDNTYGKNSAYYRAWHSELPFARFIES